MLTHLAPGAPDVLQVGWTEVLGHTLHYGVLGGGLVGVLYLALPGRRAPRGRRRTDDAAGRGETP